jgi:hypothetical protein
VVFLIAGCTGADSDGNIHNCTITYGPNWASTDLRLDHTDPRYCPLLVQDHQLNHDYMTFGGNVIDPNADDYDPNGVEFIAVTNSQGTVVGSTQTHFNVMPQGFALAVYSVGYVAATGNLSPGGSPIDFGPVEVDLVGANFAIADVTLTVSFGYGSTSVTGPAGISTVPLGTYCTYGTQSTIDGLVRTGMTNDWYVDGAYYGTISGSNLQLEFNSGGPHDVGVEEIDQSGYRTYGHTTVTAQSGGSC